MPETDERTASNHSALAHRIFTVLRDHEKRKSNLLLAIDLAEMLQELQAGQLSY